MFLVLSLHWEDSWRSGWEGALLGVFLWGLHGMEVIDEYISDTLSVQETMSEILCTHF